MTEIDSCNICCDILINTGDIGDFMFFGKLQGSNNEWGFSPFKNNFVTCKEINSAVHMSFINQANSEGKLISADKDGNPILVDPPPPTQEEIRKQRINELENYLSETDWYAIRYADTGEEMPSDIKKKRQNARDEISNLRE